MVLSNIYFCVINHVNFVALEACRYMNVVKGTYHAIVDMVTLDLECILQCYKILVLQLPPT